MKQRKDNLDAVAYILFMILIASAMALFQQRSLIRELHKAIELRDKTIHTLDSIIIENLKIEKYVGINNNSSALSN